MLKFVPHRRYDAGLIPMVVLILLLLSGSVRAEDGKGPADWTQWRGPNRDAQFKGAAWPDDLSTDTFKRVWRSELPPGFGGPLVVGDRVFVVGSEGETDEVAVALDRESGDLLWKAQWRGAIQVPPIGRGQGNWIKATPAYDGQTLYAVGMEDVLVALDGATGAERWRVDFKNHYDTEQPEYGNPSSPLVYKNWVFVMGGGRLNRIVKDTGAIDWNGFYSGSARELTPFSSPVLATLAGREQLVAFFPKSLAGIDPDTGETLWEIAVETAIGAAYPTPVIYKDGVFLSLYGRGTTMFSVKQAGDGTFTCEPAWQNKAKGYMSTPVVVDGHAYVQLTNRRIVCIDLETGEDAWGTTERYGLYWGMTANGDQILSLENEGLLRLIRANTQKLDVIDERQVTESMAWAPIAFSGDEVYIRDIEGVTKYVWETAGVMNK
jgi:outer membrane protein assembly factor BamB